MANIWIKKSIPALIAGEGTHGNNLRRTLGRFNLIMLGIGGIVGAGIFVLTGQAAATYAGPAIVLSFVFAGTPDGTSIADIGNVPSFPNSFSMITSLIQT